MRSGVGNVNADKVPWLAADPRSWRTVFWVAWAVVLVARIGLAATLAPFGDEAWYWQESRALDWSFSDLPPATALLIRLGEAVFGHGVLAMRSLFLLAGALLPLVVLRIGRRVFDPAAGYAAALLTLALPLLGTLGILALPDVPLTLASACALDALERATRTRRLRDWAGLGMALAVAWLCHYRTAMLLLTGLTFLCLAWRGRALWSDPGLWLALAIACLGLIPLLVFNVEHNWVALGFQLVERNPWAFHADALVQPLEQALVCTPLFYLLLLWCAWQGLRRVHDGGPWDVFALCAIVPIVVYFVLGCFADDTRFRAHWPLPGYVPLLVMLPVLLRAQTATRQRRFALVAALGLLILGDALAFGYLAMAAVPRGAGVLARMKAFPEHFVGWREAAAQTQALLSQPRFRDAVLVADNFMLAAELDFALDGKSPVYSLDHPLNAKHGRAAQLALWQRDEAGLRKLGPRRVLLLAEPTARREREREAWMQGLCARIDGLTRVYALDIYEGRKRYRWFSGTVPAGSAAADGIHIQECDAASP
ncbi:MAG: glycosyltransferase family 39 protein [Rudaea sp.]|nr:glycosyltransferase family 39 protein [Rudaea sp.]